MRSKITPLTQSPAMVISLDFELMWGVRDHADKNSYGANVRGERQAIPSMLKLFSEFGIRATWASVGMAFAGTRDELMDTAPKLRPTYDDAHLSSYHYLDDVGKDEAADPYYFGASLIRSIQETEGQEIGSHTFSHYYCLEPGQTVEQFDADMTAATDIATRYGIAMTSFVFPRNQRSVEHLNVLERKRIKVFRGNEKSWIHRASPGAMQPAYQRIARLADHYVNLSGHNTHSPQIESNLIDVPASRFLRPYSRKLVTLDPIRFQRIAGAMTQAAQNNRLFHLWWHPHNFGVNLEQNIAFLRRILEHYRVLSDTHGMVSMHMGDFA